MISVQVKSAKFVGGGPGQTRDIHAAADYLTTGAIEVNRYQDEIFDLVRRRYVFGQRIQQVQATGHPSRYFEEIAIPVASFTDPRVISPTPTQPERIERPLMLKGLVAQINYSIFDVEVTQQQNQFAYLEAKDLTDAINSILKLHDRSLWSGSDTDLVVPSTNQYFGVSGQILKADLYNGISNTGTIVFGTDSIVDKLKTQVANMVSRDDFEVIPSTIYFNPLFGDLLDQEAKQFQLYFNETEIIPGVVVKALPTQAGLIPLVGDPGILRYQNGSQFQYTAFITMEEAIEYHWLTSPVPRVFQIGLLANLAAQFVVVKFGAVVAKGAGYAHNMLTMMK